MLRVSHANLLFVPALVFACTACSKEEAPEEAHAAADLSLTDIVGETPPNQEAMIGTFRDDKAATGVGLISLKTNWTYHKEDAVTCVRYPCDKPQANGVYRLGARGDAKLLALMDDRGNPIEVFKYMLRGASLYLAPYVAEGQGRWQELPRSSSAWCGVPADCPLQNQPVGPCAGQWTCETNVCAYSCGAPSPDTVAGGKAVSAVTEPGAAAK